MLDRATASAVLPLVGALFGMGLLALCTASLKRSFVAFRKLSPRSQMAVVTILVLLGLHVFAKNGSRLGLRFGTTPSTEQVAESVRHGGHALVGVQTDIPLDLSPSPFAVTNADWLASGTHEDWALVTVSNTPDWAFRLGTSDVSRLFVSSSGIVSPVRKLTGTAPHPFPDSPYAPFLAPFHASLGLVPEANCPMPGANSLFWHDVTSNGSLRLTWQHALWNRVTTAPVSFQAELFPSGDFTYRYDFSLLPEGFWTNPPQYTIGYQNNGGGELWTNTTGATTVQLDWRGFGVLPDSATDSDGDGLGDYEELYEYGTDPTLVDSDGDGLTDAEDNFPNVCDADGDGLPDGADEYAWQHNTLLAENAGYTNLVLTVVRGMAPAVRNAAPSASALLQLDGFAIPLYEGATWNLGVPSGEWCDARLVVRDNLPVQLELSPGSTERPFYLDDPKGIFGSGTSANASARLAFPTLFLVPEPATRNECLHGDDDGVLYHVALHPMRWEEHTDAADIQEFSIQSDNTLWLMAPELTVRNTTGRVVFDTPWLSWGVLEAEASIHWCRGEGYYCLACGVVHIEANACSHSPDCASVHSALAECTCPPLLLRVNLDDDNLDEVEDRQETPDFSVENEVLEFRPVGLGGCCCEFWQQGDIRARVTDVSPGVRLWSATGSAVHSNDALTGEFLMEATSATPTNGAGLIRYDVLNKDGTRFRDNHRSFTAANVWILPDFDCNGIMDFEDTYLKETRGTNGAWTLIRRPEPYRVVLRNACPSDAVLSIRWTASTTNAPGCMAGPNSEAERLPPNTTVTNAPFAVKNQELVLWIDASGPNAEAVLSYTIDFGGLHPSITDSVAIWVVDISLHDYAVTTNEVPSVVYDCSATGLTAEWCLYDLDDDEEITRHVGSTFDVPDNLELHTYCVTATFSDVYDNGDPCSIQSSLLYVGSIQFEPQTAELDPTGLHVYNPSCLGTGRTAYFKADVSANFEDIIHWTADPALNVEFQGTPTGPEVQVTGKFFGDTDIRMEIDGFLGPVPQTTVRIVPTNTIPVNVWIVHNGAGEYASREQFIVDRLQKANDIFYHAGLHFQLESISYTNNNDWMTIEQDGKIWPESSSLTGITNNTNGIECYVVKRIANAIGLNTDTGMLISSEANLTTLAHEIGHACGLADIYTKRENLGLYLTGEATFVRNQEDWGTDSQRGYYPDGILQQTLVQRDLMCSEVPGTRADIARGDIEGLWYDQAQNPVTGDYEKTWHNSSAPVGMTTHGTLLPKHR